MIYLFSAPLSHYATTNIEKIYQSIEEMNDTATVNYSYTVQLYDETSGTPQGTFDGESKGSIQTFVKFIYNVAKTSKKIDLIDWAAKEISKYDNSNPTINSLIYSLWSKSEQGKDQTGK